MSLQFTPATRSQARARIALIGPSGSGKTWTSLALASVLAGDQPVAVIDSERASAAKYALHGDDGFSFLHLDLPDHSPHTYTEAIDAAAKAGVGCLIIDSLSHAWAGRGGALEMVDKAAARSRSGNSFAAWREVTPHHHALVDAILAAPMHVICTLRSKTEWVLEKDGKGRTSPRKIGLSPVQRDGVEYEFDIVADMDDAHRLIVSKTRCKALDGAVIEKPGEALGRTIADWLAIGGEAKATPKKKRKPKAKPAPEVDPEPEGVTIYQTRERIGVLLREDVWKQSEIAAVLGTFGAKKVADLEADDLAAVWERLHQDPPGMAELEEQIPDFDAPPQDTTTH